MTNGFSELFNKLIATLRFKVTRNACYYNVLNDFTTDNYNVYKSAMLLPTQIIGDNNDDNIYMSVMYKLNKNNTDVDEGLINMTYQNLASLLISNKIQAVYCDDNTIDTEIQEILNQFRGV